MYPPWVLAADWSAPARVRGLVTTRQGPGMSAGPFAAFNLGDACGDEPAAVAFNRECLTQALRLPSDPCWLRQVHGAAVARFPHPCETDPPAADAAITDQAGTVLAVLSADCLPVLLCATDGSEIAVAHAGWRGLAAGVLEATLAAMRTPSSRVLAWLGPAIGAQRYEVGEDVREAFIESDAKMASAFRSSRQGHWHCDLYALARQRLDACGVAEARGGGLCAYSDATRFYSHRRDGTSGRMASLLWLDQG